MASYAVCDVFFEAAAFEPGFARLLPPISSTVESKTELFVAMQIQGGAMEAPTVLVPISDALSLDDLVRIRLGRGHDVPLSRGKSVILDVNMDKPLDALTFTLLSIAPDAGDKAAAFLASGGISIERPAHDLLRSPDHIGITQAEAALHSLAGARVATLAVVVKLSMVPNHLQPFFAQQMLGQKAALEAVNSGALGLSGHPSPDPTATTLAALATTVRRTAGLAQAQVQEERMDRGTAARIARGSVELASPNIYMPPPLWYGALGGGITVTLPLPVPPPPPAQAHSLQASGPGRATPPADLAIVDRFLSDLLRWKAFTAHVTGRDQEEGGARGVGGLSTPSRKRPSGTGMGGSSPSIPVPHWPPLADTPIGDGFTRSTSSLARALVDTGVDALTAGRLVRTLAMGHVSEGRLSARSGRLLTLAALAEEGAEAASGAQARSSTLSPTPLVHAYDRDTARALELALPRTFRLVHDKETPEEFRAALCAIARLSAMGEAEGLPIGAGRATVQEVTPVGSPARASGRMPGGSPSGSPPQGGKGAVYFGRPPPIPPTPPTRAGGGTSLTTRASSATRSVGTSAMDNAPGRGEGMRVGVAVAVAPPVPGSVTGVRLPAHLRARIAAMEEEKREARLASRRSEEESARWKGEASTARLMAEASHLSTGPQVGPPSTPSAGKPILDMGAPPPRNDEEEVDISAVGRSVHLREVGMSPPIDARTGPRQSGPAPSLASVEPVWVRMVEAANRDRQEEQRGVGPTARVRPSPASTGTSTLSPRKASSSPLTAARGVQRGRDAARSRGYMSVAHMKLGANGSLGSIGDENNGEGASMASGGQADDDATSHSMASSAGAQARKGALAIAHASALDVMPSARANMHAHARDSPGKKGPALAVEGSSVSVASDTSLAQGRAKSVTFVDQSAGTGSAEGKSEPSDALLADMTRVTADSGVTGASGSGGLSISTDSHGRGGGGHLFSPGTPAIFRGDREEGRGGDDRALPVLQESFGRNESGASSDGKAMDSGDLSGPSGRTQKEAGHGDESVLTDISAATSGKSSGLLSAISESSDS